MKHPETLNNGIKILGLNLNENAQKKLLRYLGLLEKWNQAYNLTAITDFDKMITHHLLDSLSVIPYLQGQQILDVGTGAGLPGIPLAIARPDQHYTLLDSNGKKVRFLLQISAELALPNVTPIQSRIEDYRPTQPFDVIISRALGSARDLIDKSRALLSNNGRYLLMKGKYPTEEESEIPADFISKVLTLEVPGLPAERHLMVITKEDK